MSFPGGSVVKNPPTNTGDAGSVPGSGRSPGGGNGNPLQCSCLGNPMDREETSGSPCGRKELDMTEQSNNKSFRDAYSYRKMSSRLTLLPGCSYRFSAV